MNVCFALLFALVAAIGNALFAYAQRRSVGIQNGLVFVSISAVLAGLLTFLVSPLFGSQGISELFRPNTRNILISVGGLLLTYIGFNLLFTRFGVSAYVLYAVLSILTTTVFVGIFWMHEPVNGYKLAAIAFSIAAVVFYSIGQSCSN